MIRTGTSATSWAVLLLAAAVLPSCGSDASDPRPTATISEPSATSFVEPGGSVVFSGACTLAPGSFAARFVGADDPPTHAWTFPGGSPSASTEASPGAVAFESAGSFVATYACTDALGRVSEEATRLVVVRDPAAAGEYQVTLEPLTDLTARQAQAFLDAQARLQQIVTGDLPEVNVGGASFAGCGETPVGVVDDLLIFVRIIPIDGPGATLGQAGPCLVRSQSGLPLLGIMEFDSADALELERVDLLDAVVLHEMLHVLGFGTVWDLFPYFDLLVGAGTADPYFVGPAAQAAFVDWDGGDAYPGNPVPVENTGGAGTRDGHWREAVLGDELMTGFLSARAQPLSRTTIMSLWDLGYEVDPSSAETLSVLPAEALVREAPGGEVDLGEDLRRGPVHEVDEGGAILPRR
jgi:hypothetical protein